MSDRKVRFQPGEVLHGKYRVQARIGIGAFGEVYHVTHLRLNAARAIKILHRDMPGVGSQHFQKARERFVFEAQLGARLDHPNVIKVHDFEEAQGELLLVMEYAPGDSLAGRLQGGETLSMEEAVHLCINVCAGLEALYTQLEAVHRDIKPSNLLFSADGSAKVGDLGLAQVPGDESRRSLLGSLAAGHPGTPLYMSPEQENTKGYLLPSSDIFSLGCVLFEVLTGKPYKNSYGKRVCELRSDLPAWLDAIVERALREQPGRLPADDTDPAKRYRLASLMQAELERAWEGELARREAERQRREAEARARAAAEERTRQKAAERARREAEAEERLRQEAEERARREAERRASEIDRLKGEIEGALNEENWSRTENRIAQLEGLGSDGLAAAGSLKERFNREKAEAKERDRKIRELRSEALATIATGDWEIAREIIQQFGELGTVGQRVARELDARLGAAQRAAERHRRWQALFSKFKPWAPWMGTLGVGITVIFVLFWSGVFDPLFSSTPEPQETPVVQSAPVVTDTPIVNEATPTSTAQSTAVTVTDGLPQSIVDPHGVPMVLVPAGEFWMGSEAGVIDERPVHAVLLDDFYIDKYEVSKALYATFLNELGNQIEGGTSWLDESDEDVLVLQSGDKWAVRSGYEDHPVIEVTWYGARAYCSWREARLPTEAEWEKAARGTDGRYYPWGEGIDCTKANYSGQEEGCVGDTTTVGGYPEGASPYGALDMAGNVWEWVADWYNIDYYKSSPYKNPVGPVSGDYRVLRGGSWSNNGGNLRASNRGRGNPGNVYDGSGGFRCARSISESFLATLQPTSTLVALPQITIVQASTTPTLSTTLSVTESPASIVDDFGVPMVFVPAGEFEMGSDEGDNDERPVHMVYLNSYYIDKYEVTNSRYKECVAAGSCYPPWYQGSYNRDRYYEDSTYADYPVIWVGQPTAQTYCEWRGARLPTEAEWEKAARGTDGGSYPWGEGINCTKANYYECNLGDTVRVGSYPEGASPYGALDMAGNVWEWVADWYASDYYGNSPASNPLGPETGTHIPLRGGSWISNPDHLRTASRVWIYPAYWFKFIGFRCARSP